MLTISTKKNLKRNGEKKMARKVTFFIKVTMRGDVPNILVHTGLKTAKQDIKGLAAKISFAKSNHDLIRINHCEREADAMSMFSSGLTGTPKKHSFDHVLYINPEEIVCLENSADTVPVMSQDDHAETNVKLIEAIKEGKLEL